MVHLSDDDLLNAILEPHVPQPKKKPQAEQPLAITVVKHSVGVNMGDHAQDVIKSLSVPPATTVEELVRKHLVSNVSYNYSKQYDDFLIIRLNEPWDCNES